MFIIYIISYNDMANEEQVALLEKALADMKGYAMQDEDRLYRIKPIDHKKIKKFLEESPDRYLDVRDFISKAIEIFYTWETNPLRAKAMMMEMEQTVPQLAQMKAMMKPEEFEAMNKDRLENEPGLEEKIDRFLNEHPAYLVSGRQEIQKETSAIEAQEKERLSKGDLQKLISSQKDSIKFIQDTDFESIVPVDGQTEIYYDGWPLLWNYYSRMLPAKIAIMAIADIMHKNKSPVIELDENNKAHIYDIAEELSEILIKEEKKMKLKRENKLSTGFPKPPDMDEHLSDDTQKTILNAISRYKDRIIGKTRKDRQFGDVSFDGMLSALGLVRTFAGADDKITYMTLTENGKMFCMLENPVLNGDYKSAFSSEETQFIVRELIPQRALEHRLMQAAVEVVKLHSEGSMTSNISKSLDDRLKTAIEDYLRSENDDQIVGADLSETILSTTERIEKENVKLKAEKKKEKQTPVGAYRVAIMGRLSEMGVLKWTINKDASSSYEIADARIAKELLK